MPQSFNFYINNLWYDLRSLVTYLKEQLALNKGHFVLEMAMSKKERWGNEQYRVAIHGQSTTDRSSPHIHIYSTKDKNVGATFNFEVSLVDLLCYDEINLIRQKNGRKDITHKSKCSWKGYKDIEEGFEDWLYGKCNMPGEYTDNLHWLVWPYNHEANYDNVLQKYLDNKGLKVLDKYKKYFDDEQD